MTEHREVPVKVNAWVDMGIADLVTALSAIEGLVTLESCQGNPDGSDAFVVFRYGDWKQCGDLLFGRLLVAMSADLRAVVSLRLEAYDVDTARAWIVLDARAVSVFTRCVREALAPPVRPRVLVARDAHG
jgi:hypothetical protein